MQIDRDRIRQLLKDFELKTLLIEELGWDHHSGEVAAEIREREIDETEYLLTAIAEKRGMAVFHCSARSDGSIPAYATRRKIQREVAKSVHEHLIIYTDADKTTQIWQWVKREPGKPLACREHRYHHGQSGEPLIQKLETIAVSFDEQGGLTLTDVTGRVRAAFDVERVTKRFYDRFKTEHNQFLNFLEGISDQEMERWYASVMLNRLMFIYFIQKKGFLNDDPDYLRTKLEESKVNSNDRYYTDFLCPLFFEGFAKPESEQNAKTKRLLGKVPYLNGGIFQRHQIEELHGVSPCQGGQGGSIQIADAAFEKLFDFFEAYQWHLDERPLRNDNEINPDVLGYIFEKYINQKQMGAYYTKEDITEYISKNTIIPSLFDTARKACRIAFEPVGGISDPDASMGGSVWQLLRDDPDRYIYDAVKTGVQLDLPEEIAAGIDDVSKRGIWNTPAPDEYALPTEIWREVVARRERYESIYAKLSNGEIDDINALITYNLNIGQFAHDVIENCEGPELLRAFWKAITEVTILDPTCGSGAFLFAALNILEPLYEACLDRMGIYLNDLHTPASDVGGASLPRFSRGSSNFRNDLQHAPPRLRGGRGGNDFRKILERIEQHPNRRYFILKSIIINNLYGVDIMEEAIEICKLRLFLKMVAQIEDVRQIEPLPDIDFNIQAGNTLVGYATYDEVEKVITGKFDFDNTMQRIAEKAEDVEHLFERFREQQTELGGDVASADKQVLRDKLKALEDELNRYLADEYKVDPNKESAYQHWLSSHKPFHWFIEFYGILKNGGFDVIIGNPPYVGYSKVKKDYTLAGYETENCGNLYAFIIERSLKLLKSTSMCGMIIPISAFSNRSMEDLQQYLKKYPVHISNFHQRPAQLFEGVLQRLSIFLMKNSKHQKGKIYTTSVTRWYTEARDKLFDNLVFTSSPQSSKQRHTLKIGNNIEASILEKYRNHKEIREYLLPTSQTAKNFIAYRTAGGGYWWTFLNSEFKTRSLSNKVAYFAEQYDARVFMATLNSSLFWWYYFISYDLFNLKDYMIFSFQLNYPTDKSLERELICLAEQLQKELLGNAIEYLIESKTKGPSYTFRYQNYKSKPTIDEIDRVLAQHYGFTDEELDFIINYDIKYRMGLGND